MHQETVAGFLTAVFCYVYRPSRQREQQSIRVTIRAATGVGSCVTALTTRQLLNERYALLLRSLVQRRWDTGLTLFAKRRGRGISYS